MNARNQIDRIPPYDIAAERALIGSCLIDGRCIDAVIATVQASDFFDQDYGKLFRTLCVMRQSRIPIDDLAILRPALKAAGVADDVASVASIAKMLTEGSASYPGFYAAAIVKASKLRKQILACEQAIQAAYQDEDPDDISGRLAADIRGMAGYGKDVPESIGDVAKRLLDDFEPNSTTGRPVLFGIQKIDTITGGMCAGELVVIAARPGCGKTSMATQIARNVASKRGQVLFVSIEMTKKELATREMCGDSEVPSRRVRQRQLTPRDRSALLEAASGLQKVPMWIWAPPRTTCAQIAGVARMRQQVEPLNLIVVDYLQRVKAEDRRANRVQQIGEISGDLKELAKECDVPVIALAQLNREGEDEPRLSNLREGGDIEADADMVLILHKTKDGTKGILAKHRHGETGTLDLEWDGSRTRFDDGRF